jgi:hypothetical protein
MSGGFQHTPYDPPTYAAPTYAAPAPPAAPAAAAKPAYTADPTNDWYYYGGDPSIAQGTPWMTQQAKGTTGGANATSTIGQWGRRQADGSIQYMPDPWKTPS